MVQRTDGPPPVDDGSHLATSAADDLLGEAIEEYLTLVEQNQTPELEEFLARYPDFKEDLRAAMEGLELVHGLVGVGSSPVSGSGRGTGADRWLESGRRIAGYRVVRELGRGGMGTVYEAVHVGLDRPVALKVLGTHAAPDSSARRRFLNEARTAAGLHHTHIVPVFDVGKVGGLCYYAMQRIEGSGLDRVIRHLRRTRPVVGSAGSAGPSPASWDGRSGSGNTSPSSRFGRLWVRVSAGWLWRPPQPGSPAPGRAGPDRDGADSLGSRARSGLRGLGGFPTSFLDDATASWKSRRSAVESDPGRCPRPDPAGSSHAPDTPSPSSPDLARPEPHRRDDEPPPFDPPRGSAYFRWVATVGLQSADALAHAHQQGVIHRDVKPSNLLVDAKGNIWVTDFGLARRLADPGLTHHDSLMGTPRYMSPEQARTGSIDGRTDVYSLGATLYELLTARPPFDGQTASELLDQIGRLEPVPPRKILPRVPRDLETIVLKALAKRPIDRYESATDLAEDLARFLNREPVKARRISPIGRLWRVARRHPGISIVSATAAATVLAIATFAYVSIIAERNEAIEARHEAQKELRRREQAERRSDAAVRKLLVQSAEMVGATSSPNRRSDGMKLIHGAVSLGIIEPELRAQLRDVAIRLLVQRDTETGPGLPTGRIRSLTFGPGGTRLAVLSEDGEELSLWDIATRRPQWFLSLRSGSGPTVVASSSSNGEPNAVDAVGSSGLNSGRGGGGTGSAGSGPRRNPFGPRLAQAGHSLAVVLPDGRGFCLVDPLSGTPLRPVNRPPDREVLGLVADSAGRRLVTIERMIDEPVAEAIDGIPAWDPSAPNEFQVNLWDLDHLDQPIASLPPPRFGPLNRNRFANPSPPSPPAPPPAPEPPSPNRSRSANPKHSAWPLVTLSPEGKVVAISSMRGMWVRLFSAEDGKDLPRPIPPGTGSFPERSGRRVDAVVERAPAQIPTGIELTAVALGPNGLLATAGTSTETSRGNMVKLWDADNPSPWAVALASFAPNQNFTTQLRFNPQGTLLGLVGPGPIELWDPAAHSQVTVLRMSDQLTDLAFSPDNRTLVAGGRALSAPTWTVLDSTARTQLSGFDARLSSLAFSDEGTLAGGEWDGNVWTWRTGRCPIVGSPQPPVPEPQPVATRPESRTAALSKLPAPAVKPRSPISGPAGSPAGSPPTGRPGPESRGPDPTPRDGDRGRPRNWGMGPFGGMSREQRPTSLAFDDQGRLVAHDPWGLRVWSPGSLAGLMPPTIRLALPRVEVTWRNPTPLARTTDGRFMALVRTSAVFLWDSESPDRIRPVSPPARPGAEDALAAKANPRGEPTAPTLAPGPRFRAVQIAPQGERLYLLAEDHLLHVWALEAASEGDQARDIPVTANLPESLTSLALRPDGAVLALGDRNGTVTLLDTRSLTVIDRLRPVSAEAVGFVIALAFSPDGSDLAVGTQESTILVWPVVTPAPREPRLSLPTHRGTISSLAFDHQGRRLASTSETDPLVEVWDLELIQRELNRLGLAN